MRWIGRITMCAVFAATGCGFVPPPVDRTADVLVVGDSILAWHRGTGRSIPDVAEIRTGLSISNVSLSGARFLGEQGIPTQYESGNWQVVVFDGGGNDISAVCGTVAEAAVLDSLISADGSRGAIPEFASRILGDGAQVVVLGYYPISINGGPFAPCRATLDALGDRQNVMAQAMNGVTFVDSGDVIAADNLAAYSRDLVHPTPLGAMLVGEQLGQVLARTVQR